MLKQTKVNISEQTNKQIPFLYQMGSTEPPKSVAENNSHVFSSILWVDNLGWAKLLCG